MARKKLTSKTYAQLFVEINHEAPRVSPQLGWMLSNASFRCSSYAELNHKDALFLRLLNLIVVIGLGLKAS